MLLWPLNAFALILVIKFKLLKLWDYVLFLTISPDHNTLLSTLLAFQHLINFFLILINCSFLCPKSLLLYFRQGTYYLLLFLYVISSPQETISSCYYDWQALCIAQSKHFLNICCIKCHQTHKRWLNYSKTVSGLAFELCLKTLPFITLSGGMQEPGGVLF